jgi:hypothetical protein
VLFVPVSGRPYLGAARGDGVRLDLYNMTRNTGAEIGVAKLTSMLVHNQNIHQVYLVQHFSAFDAWRLGRLTPREPGSPAFQFLGQMISGQKQGLGMGLRCSNNSP